MTILSALTHLYKRMADAGEVPRPGYSTEKISFALVLGPDGQPRRLVDKRSLVKEKPQPVMMNVPTAGSRTSGIKPCRLWDKSAYVFGVVASEQVDADGVVHVVPGQDRRTANEHAAFVAAHQELLGHTNDLGLVALRRFVESWKPEMFAALGFHVDALDQNIVFEFDDGSSTRFIHDRPAAIALLDTPSQAQRGFCLVTGDQAPIERLHPKIKGVKGAQSSGAALVSFNDDAYESFGKSQGNNAPVGESAAFAYGAALNALLAKDSNRHLQVGDDTVVFWAEAANNRSAALAETLMNRAIHPPDDNAELTKLRSVIADVAAGRAAHPDIDHETRVYLLGLAPNAARLSVRFWYPGKFGDFAKNVSVFWQDLEIVPAAWKGPPAIWSVLYETAVRVGGKPKADTIPDVLAGQVMRSVLTGQALPRTLLTAVIARIRADGYVNGRRAAICKAVVNRTSRKEGIPVSLNANTKDPAYCLGRLFAAYAYAEQSFADRNASIRDKYLAGASANPARVFPLLMRGYEHNRSGLLKAVDKRAFGIKADNAVSAILEQLSGGVDLPVSQTMDEQARFFVGFYHQYNSFFSKPEEAAEAAAKASETEETGE